MKTTFCVRCGSTENLQHHHIVPRSEGGIDEETNYLTFCGVCHNTVHAVSGIKSTSKLTKRGIDRTRMVDLIAFSNLARDVQQLGWPKKTKVYTAFRVLSLWEDGVMPPYDKAEESRCNSALKRMRNILKEDTVYHSYIMDYAPLLQGDEAPRYRECPLLYLNNSQLNN